MLLVQVLPLVILLFGNSHSSIARGHSIRAEGPRNTLKYYLRLMLFLSYSVLVENDND
jgi:hypothetical protein